MLLRRILKEADDIDVVGEASNGIEALKTKEQPHAEVGFVY